MNEKINVILKSPITALITVVCVGIFGAINLVDSDLSYWGYVAGYELWEGKYWGFITSAFVHADFLHLFFNLYWLWLLGPQIEQVLGKRKFLFLVVIAACVSSATQFVFSGETGIGFSGVIYFFVGLMWIARPTYPQEFEVMGPQNLRFLLGWLALCFILDAMNIYPIANGAHVGGLIFGMCVGQWIRFNDIKWLSISTFIFVLVFIPLLWAPWLAGWWNQKALLATKDNELSAAVNYYDKAIELADPEEWAGLNARIKRIELFFIQEDYKKIIEDLKVEIKNTSSDWAYYYYAEAYFHLEQYNEALYNYEKIPKGDYDFLAETGKAKCLSSLYRFKEALNSNKRIIELAPKFISGYLGAAQMSLMLDNRVEAINFLRLANKEMPDDVYMALWLALVEEESSPLVPFANIEGWMGELVRYGLGEQNETELLKSSGLSELWGMPSEELRCEAEGYIGLRLDIQQGIAAARPHYEATVTTGVKDFIEYNWAKLRLTLINDEKNKLLYKGNKCNDANEGDYPQNVNFRFEEIPLLSSLKLLAEFSCNEIKVKNVQDKVISTNFIDTPWEYVIDTICVENNLYCSTENDILYVSETILDSKG